MGFWEICVQSAQACSTFLGGGIGILIADFQGGVVADNIVSHNKVSGTLHVSDGDCGGYSGSGIVLYADFRWNRGGTDSIEFNRVVKNKVSLVSDNPGLVDVNGIELTEAITPVLTDHVIYDNTVKKNDLRGTEKSMLLTPPELEDVNDISKNKLYKPKKDK